MKTFNKILISLSFLIIGLMTFSCQDFDRPDMVIIPDPEEIPYDPMKIFIPFDDNSPADKSIYAFATTPTGVEYVDGVSSTAMQGADGRYLLIGKPAERADIMDTLKNMGSFTTAFWINLPDDATGGAQMIFSMPNSEKGWGNLDIFTDGANENGLTLKIHMWNYRTGSAAETWQVVSLPNATGKWTHVAVRYDGKTSKFTLFQNKTQVHEATIADFGDLAFDKVAGSFVIGTFGKQTNPPLTSDSEKWDWAKAFQGKIDQFRLYNKALSDSEIGAIYGSEAPGGFGEIFYMPFDGDYVDKISSLAATPEGTPGFDDAGKKGKAYKGAANSYLSFPIAGIAAEEFSATFWYKLSATPGNAGILTVSADDLLAEADQKNNRTKGFRLFREGDAASQIFKLNVGTGTSDSWLDGGDAARLNPATTGADWVFMAFSISTTGAAFYINGESVTTVEITGISWEDCTNLSIGSGAPYFTQWGHLSDINMIDELRIFNKALTQDEIKNIMNAK